MRSVHLRVVELEGQLKRCFKQTFMISAPDYKGIVENSAVHAYRAVNSLVNYSGCSYDHAVCNIVVFAAFGSQHCQTQVVAVKLRKAFGKRHVT